MVQAEAIFGASPFLGACSSESLPNVATNGPEELVGSDVGAQPMAEAMTRDVNLGDRPPIDTPVRGPAKRFAPNIRSGL